MSATFLTPQPAAQDAQQQLIPERLVYYRYVDPEGVVRITRKRPDTYPYDVLDP